MKKLNLVLCLATIAVCVGFVSCKKEAKPQTDEKLDNVYAVGYRYLGSAKVPVVWRNGVSSDLGAICGEACGVAASGKNVYVAGYIAVNGVEKAVLWKNGVVQAVLNEGPYDARAKVVYAFDDRVYVFWLEEDQYGYYVVKLWHNGVNTVLDRNYADGRWLACVTMYESGSDVWAARHYNNVVKQWKNGNLVMNKDYYPVSVYSLAFSDGDFYVLGKQYGYTKVWKNNNEVVSFRDGSGATIHWFYVNDGDTYIGGTDASRAVMWKNGLPTVYEGVNAVNGIFSTAKGVYVAGNGSWPKIWENGEEMAGLAEVDGISHVHCIFAQYSPGGAAVAGR